MKCLLIAAALAVVSLAQIVDRDDRNCYAVVDADKKKIKYWGKTNSTKSGRICQAWDSQTPHTHKKTYQRYPNKDLRKNFCRDPDNLGYPWCFTMDPDKKRERCGVANCADLVPAEDIPTTCYSINPESGSVMYAGNVSTTTRGLTCQKWTSQEPHEHQRDPAKFPGKGLGDHNMCRDPDGTGYPWCYTVDEGVRWESCPVANCNEPTVATEVLCIDLKTRKKFSVGAKWNPEVCAQCECMDEGEVICSKIHCDIPDCKKFFYPKGQCCPICEVECSLKGKLFEIGDQWQKDTCTQCECISNQGKKETLCTTTDCPKLPSDCQVMYIIGQCCPVCNTQCTDRDTGKQYALDSTWKYDACTNCTCYDNNGINAEICVSQSCGIPDYCYNVTRTEDVCCPSCGESAYQECYAMGDDLVIKYDGLEDKTESGLECQIWTEQSPHVHSRIPENYPDGLLGYHSFCRDPDNSGYLWCYAMSNTTRWEKCNITECEVEEKADDSSSDGESEEDNLDTCYKKDGRFAVYNGTKSTTKSGRNCMRWNQQRPHTHHFGNNSEAGTLAHPYCRDPDGEGYPWCYTMDPLKRWEGCNISRCDGDITLPWAAGRSKVAEIVRLMIDAKDSNCQYIKEGKKRVEYFGKQNITRSGIACQKWTETTPHFHTKFPDRYPDAGLGDHNFCRDPDSTGKLWCYTTDTQKRFDYCDVSQCTDDEIKALSVCDDVDCGKGGDCILNKNGEPACMCKVGYYGFNKTCHDTDECVRAVACNGDNVKCVNSDGSYDCVCDDGFYLDDGVCISDTSADPSCGLPDYVIKPFVRHDVNLQDPLECLCEAADNATIWWTKGLAKKEVDGTRGYGSSTLKFDIVRKKDIDVYQCVIKDQCSGLTRSTPIDVHAKVKPCQEGGLQKYGMVWDSKSWDEAFGYCQSFGLAFAVPKSKTENRIFIQDAWRSFHLNPNGKKFKDISWVWIAANDRLEENKFTDVHGTELSAPKWWPENPDNWKQMDPRGQDEICLHRLGGYWEDSYGWIARPFACECKSK